MTGFRQSHGGCTAKPIGVFVPDGRRLLTAAFFVYEPPSVLTYHEIMATSLVRDGWLPRVAITDIWVDDVASRSGGRALWGIPKDLAVFAVEPHRTYAAAADGQPVAGVQVDRVLMLPGRLPLTFGVSQDRTLSTKPGPGRLRSPVRGTARVGVARARWEIDADGPLGFLAGRRPLVTLALRDFAITFGS